MCGIIGYVGSQPSRSHIIDGLTRLEYRGYDASSFSCIDNKTGRLWFRKAIGGIDQLLASLQDTCVDGTLGIGHMRWSTHGSASNIANAHPHTDCTERIAVVHNGIIENHHELKTELCQSGHFFRSHTDTEIIAHLLESLLEQYDDPKNSPKTAFVHLLRKIDGAYAFACISQNNPEAIFIARKRSPLCIGIGNGEMFVASDPIAFAGKTDKVLFMPDLSFAFITKDRVELYDIRGNQLALNIVPCDFSLASITKESFEHYMLKEIYEQKMIIYNTVKFVRALSDQTWEKIGIDRSFIEKAQRIHLIGCGTSWHAGLIAQFFFEQIAQIPTNVHLASEFRYKPFFPSPNDIFIAISQSGETADTLEALRMVIAYNIPVITLTNVASSSMVRESSGFMLTQAGPEIAVASTKAFTAQLSALFWLASRMALERKLITQRQLQEAEEALIVAAEILENTIETYKEQIIKIDAPYYAQTKYFVFLGRHITYPFALEAALKVKEIAYIFVDTNPAGELKHGSLALIEENTPVFLFSCLDPQIYQKLLSNAQEVKARGAHLVIFAFEHQTELINLADKIYLFPVVHTHLVPLAMAGLVQFFAYHLAKTLGRPIDKPRNLAKSVTVE